MSAAVDRRLAEVKLPPNAPRRAPAERVEAGWGVDEVVAREGPVEVLLDGLDRVDLRVELCRLCTRVTRNSNSGYTSPHKRPGRYVDLGSWGSARRCITAERGAKAAISQRGSTTKDGYRAAG